MIRLPGEPRTGHAAPVFVDAFEEPGKLLYRFDAVIANEGGTLDLVRTPAAACGRRSGPAGCRRRISCRGRTRRRPASSTARASAPGSPTRSRGPTSTSTSPRPRATRCSRWARRSGCRGRSASACSTRYEPGPGSLFAYGVQGPAGETWCAFNRAGCDDGADGALARRRRHLQRPARAAVGRHHRPAARPGGGQGGGQPAALHPRERRGEQPDDGVAGDPGRAGGRRGGRVVLGVVGERGGARGAGAAQRRLRAGLDAGRATSGRRRMGRCSSGWWGSLRTARSLSAPGADGLHATATYTPAPGFSGADSFTYVATDARGLTSRVGDCARHRSRGCFTRRRSPAGARTALARAGGQAARAVPGRAAGERSGAALGPA